MAMPRLARERARSSLPSPRARLTTEATPTMMPTPRLCSAVITGKMKEIAANSRGPSCPMK